MWRAFFLAMGAYCCILGAECLVIDKAVLARRESPAGVLGSGQSTLGSHELVPPEWAPWSLISVGAVTMLYSFTIPRRVGA